MKKFVSVFLIVVFAWTVQLAAAPLASTSEKAMTGTEDGAGAIEKAIARPTPVKKSPLVPILIGVAAAAVIALVLILFVFKSMYNIAGTWTFTIVSSGGGSETVAIVFTGDKESGTALYDGDAPGTYTVASNDDVKIVFDFSGMTGNMNGKFTDENHLSGSATNTIGFVGTFTAVRAGTTTGKKETVPTQSGNGKKFGK